MLVAVSRDLSGICNAQDCKQVFFYIDLLIKHLNDLGFKYLRIFRIVTPVCGIDKSLP